MWQECREGKSTDVPILTPETGTQLISENSTVMKGKASDV